ncbi:MAG: hypothetical protein U9R75_06995 [Candidatus Thermoplasmatota archaeon]|nr:hypothetical protein [Candidatus Thermoplasmatota archaeon]
MSKVSDLDRVLLEMLSFKIYKKGKQPLLGIDPRIRIKKGIWTDNGIDLDRLTAVEGIPTDMGSIPRILEIERITVRKGLFRKKEEHRLAVGIRDLSEIPLISEGVRTEKRLKDGSGELLSSDVLYPFIQCRTSLRFRAGLGKIGAEHPFQTEMPDISPGAAFRSIDAGGSGSDDHDEILSLFDRKVPRDRWVKVSRTEVVKDLSTMIDFILRGSNDRLQKAFEEEWIVEFSRGGLRSPYIESFMIDLSTGPDGEREVPENMRSRFGRFLMDGPLSERVYDEMILPRLDHLMTCSPGEARKIEKELGPVMDRRTSKRLQEIVYQVPSRNRPAVIGMLGGAADRGSIDTLKKLLEYSTVKEDRSAAEDSLKNLGGVNI